jgi:multidrug efflux pump subunit AcrB
VAHGQPGAARIAVRRLCARRPGRDLAAIAETLRIATVGDYDQFLPKLNLAQRQVPIVVRLDDAARARIWCSSAWPCRAPRPGALGGWPAELAGGPAVIDRYDRSRNVNFEIELGGRLGEVTKPCASCPPCRACRPACA